MLRNLECTLFGMGIYAAVRRRPSLHGKYRWREAETGKTRSRRFTRCLGTGEYLVCIKRGWELGIHVGRVGGLGCCVLSICGFGATVGTTFAVD